MLESILVVGLATFGVTYLMCYTDGPFDILKSLRKIAGVEYIMITPDDEGYKPPTKFFAKLLTCHWCAGTWVATLMSILYVFLVSGNFISLVWIIPASLGLSGVLCERIT